MEEARRHLEERLQAQHAKEGHADQFKLPHNFIKTVCMRPARPGAGGTQRG